MKDFIPQYLENDMDLPKEYAINFNFLWESEQWLFVYRDIKYHFDIIDIMDIKYMLYDNEVQI